MRHFLPLFLLGCATAPAPAPVLTTAAPVVVPFTRQPVPAALAPLVIESPTTASYDLPNGMKLMVIERKRKPLVSVRLLFASGSAADPNHADGATFVAFGLLGESYEVDASGKPLVAEKSLRRQLMELGATWRSGVTHDFGQVGIDGYAKDVETYLTKLSNAVIRPRCGEYTFAEYRRSMANALDDLEVGDDAVLEQVLTQASFGIGHAYSRPTTGTPASLEELSFDDVKSEQKRMLNPAQATLLVVGDVSAEKVAQMTRAAFASWRSRGPAVSSRIAPPDVTPRRAVRMITRIPASTTLMCATRALGDVPLDDPSVDVLANILGGGLNGRLTVLREKLGVSYSPGVTVVRRKFGRGLLMCARITGSSSNEGVAAFLDAIEATRTQVPTATEIDRSKAVLISRLTSGGDDVHGVLNSAMEKLVYGTTAEDRAARIREVTADGVHAVAERVLDPTKLHLVLVGQPATVRAAIDARRLGPVSVLRMADLSSGATAPRAKPRRTP